MNENEIDSPVRKSSISPQQEKSAFEDYDEESLEDQVDEFVAKPLQ